jgi:ligand-binding sensor domain-containing protein
MYQDRDGYLWSGGYGGLTRFDGKVFVNYSPKNGLIDHNVSAIIQDSSGLMFIGTGRGLSIISKKKIFNYSLGSKREPLNITCFCRSQNKIYIGTLKGLFIYSKGKIDAVSQFPAYKINCMSAVDGNEILVGTDKGLIIFSPEKLDLVDESKGLPSDVVNCVTVKSGLVVIGTDAGLAFYNAKTKRMTSYFIENGLIDENISTLLNQNDEYLWIGSQTGLLRFDGDQFFYYNIGYDNNSNVVRCLLRDRENNIWSGTHSGLFKYRDNSFSTFDKINGPGNAFIFQIFRDKSGNLWTCSENNGVYKYYQGYFKRYGIKDGLGTNVCITGLQDSDGRLLFGTKNGIVQFRNERFYEIPLPKKFSGPIEMIYQTHDHTTWAGGTNGILSLKWKGNSPEFKFYPIKFSEPLQVFTFCEDDRNNLWVGTAPGGLYMLSGDSLRRMNREFNTTEAGFYSIKAYKDLIFSATLNGLFILNTKTKKLRYISEQDGLNSELVYSIEFAENHKALWIGTNQGVNKLNLKKYLDSGIVEIAPFGKQQGFMGVECNSNGIWEDPDGSIWFGTVSGLVKHEPFNLKRNNVPNTINIENIKLFSEDTLLPDNSKLPSGYNTITFYYRGICLTNPEKVLYQKKLDGLEKDWSFSSNEDYSKYANLAPGKYTFRVKSCNNEGLWDGNEATFTFTILRPFYATWWFILVVVVGAASLIYIVVMLRIRNIKRKQKAEYDRKVEVSRIELKALRSQMNPHFIFNSLNSIQHYIFHTKSEEAIKYLNKFARLVRIILNNSEKPTVTVGDDIEALKLYLELEQMRFEDKFDYEVNIDATVDTDYDIMPPLLMQPYVENAILHGLNPKPGRGKLTISLTSENNYLICTITDNGIGREKAAEIKRTMPVNKHKSLGMKITEDRLKILNEVNNSQLSVNITDLKGANGEALGTRVELFVPYL